MKIRQKIEEAPTPYRYGSESDQSECESDGERLGKKHYNDSNHKPHHPKRNVFFTAPVNNQANMISDSWETVNAKLQYEKHLQDLLHSDSNDGDMCSQASPMKLINDSVQRSQFYQQPTPSSAGIEDIQTSFGEIVQQAQQQHPCPAAWSPQFTRKYYRNGNNSNNKRLALASASENDVGDGKAGSGSEKSDDSSSGTARKNKVVLIKQPHHVEVCSPHPNFRHQTDYNNNSNGGGTSGEN